MITMVNKNLILIKYFREGASIQSISQSLHISRQVVRKYIREHEKEFSSTKLEDKLELGLSTKPVYDISTREKRKLTSEIETEIHLCLEKNKEKRIQGLHKQLMKKIDIYDYLQSLGFTIGYTTVCNYIRNIENNGKESFVKQVYLAGHTCEFDWADVKLKINGKLQVLNLAVFTSAYSNFRWAKLFYRQDTLAFSQSHIDFFSYVSGVYQEIVYDNMRVAVAKFIGRTEKQATHALLELSNYYKFGFRFCNVRKGNEKGHVERSVEYVRRKSFCIEDEFASVIQANSHLLKTCEKLNNTSQKLKEGKNANDLFEIEKSHLYPTSIPYKCFKDDYAKVDKYSTIILYGNRYSVPDFLVGKLLNVRVFAEKLDLYFNTEKVCNHIRSYGAHSWTLDINHYLTTLACKPGALKGSLAFKQMSKDIKDIYQEYFKHNSKDFIELLQYCKDKNIEFEIIKQAINKLITISPSVGKDKILAVISKEKEPTQREEKKDEIVKYAQASIMELSEFLNLN